MNIVQHIKMFDLIAPIYGWFFQYQVKNYRRIVSKNQVFFLDAKKVLDLGCGTGALCSVLAEQGLSVTGLDGSPKMIRLAKRLNQGNTAAFKVGNALSLDTTELSYDIVVASYVLHGLPQEQRMQLYRKMKSLATRRVIIMDYNQKRGLLTSLIEWIERGDYFDFIRSAETEMRQIFPSVEVIQTGKRAAWYICNLD